MVMVAMNSMKRRGFLGFLAGGAVAGPGMVKNAAQQTIADLGVAGGGELADPVPRVSLSAQTSADQLRKLLGRTAMQHAYYRKRVRVDELDPDLASLRSPALHWRISQQRERSYQRECESERGWLEARIARWFD